MFMLSISQQNCQLSILAQPNYIIQSRYVTLIRHKKGLEFISNVVMGAAWSGFRREWHEEIIMIKLSPFSWNHPAILVLVINVSSGDVPRRIQIDSVHRF